MLPGKKIIFGPFGISKTTSILFYHYLSSEIHKYLFLTTKSERENFYKAWQEKNIEVPKKVLYWSVKLG